MNMQQKIEAEQKDVQHQIDIAVGLKIRELRKSNGMSQTQLANLVGVTFQQVQKIERAKNRISAGRLCVIALHFGLTPDYFFKEFFADQCDMQTDRAQLLALVQAADPEVITAIMTLLNK